MHRDMACLIRERGFKTVEHSMDMFSWDRFIPQLPVAGSLYLSLKQLELRQSGNSCAEGLLVSLRW